MRKSLWYTEFRCESCEEVVTQHTKMYSNGRCPYCGVKGEGASTIINTTEHAFRYVYKKHWMAFWEFPTKEYK